ncbi:MAG: polysaccharide export protein [Alphaproteobacteria bacterium]|nr:polysaccharide export protein [Alphaproteobacteria bacterium]
MRRHDSAGMGLKGRPVAYILALISALVIAGCSSSLPPPPTANSGASEYRIGAGDTLQVFVWQNAQLSTTVPVRPDGKISLPLISDLQAAGKTPTELSADISTNLKKYVNDPLVTVIVSSFVGTYAQQVRVVGEAAKPQSLPFRENMSVLDAMIAVGGLTPYAAGDRATLVRSVAGKQSSYRLRLDDLIKDGDMSANVPLEPGDVIIIPQTYF